MTKDEAIAMIDKTKDGLINPVELLHWVWLRRLIMVIPRQRLGQIHEPRRDRRDMSATALRTNHDRND